MQKGAELDITKYIRYEPNPIVKVVIRDGSITKGDYIPQLGSVESVQDDGDEIEKAEAREKPFIITTRVTDEMFKEIDPHLQFKILLGIMEKLMVKLKAAYNKHGINKELEGEDEDKEEDPLQRFYKEYGGGKMFNMLK